MEGPLMYLEKGTQKWMPYHCRINPTCFYYDDTKSAKVSSVPLNLIKNVVGKEGDSKYLIITLVDGTILSFLARSRGEAARWSSLMLHPLTEYPSITVACPCARNLAAADANGFSDPYCDLNILDSQGKLIVKLETHKIMKTLNPVWDHVFYVSEELNVLGVPQSDWPSLTFYFEVYDWDAVGSNDFIGQCKFVLKNVPQGSIKQEWVTLEQREDHKDETVSGQIKLGIFWETQEYLQKKASFSFGRNIQALPSSVLPNYSAPIPQVLIRMQEYLVSKGGLQTVGIFRLAPEEREVDVVKASINEGRFTQCSDVNCIAHLIKVWCRDLPQRLMETVDRTALTAATTKDEAAGSLVKSLFDPEASVLSWLLDLCVLVCRDEEVNKMSPKNLAIVFAPNLGSRIDDPLAEHKLVKDLTDWLERAITWRKAHPGERVQGIPNQLQAEESPTAQGPAAAETLEELALAAMFRQIRLCLSLDMLPDYAQQHLNWLVSNEHGMALKRATPVSSTPSWQQRPAERPYYWNLATGETAWAPPGSVGEEKDHLPPWSRTKTAIAPPAESAPRIKYSASVDLRGLSSHHFQAAPVAAAAPPKPATPPSSAPAAASKPPPVVPAPRASQSTKKGSKGEPEQFDPSAVYADFDEFSGGKKKSKKK